MQPPAQASNPGSVLSLSQTRWAIPDSEASMSQETDLTDLLPPWPRATTSLWCPGLPATLPRSPVGSATSYRKDTVPSGGRWQVGA